MDTDNWAEIKQLLTLKFDDAYINSDNWDKMFDMIEREGCLPEDDVLHRIKDKLIGTPVYNLWKMDDFDINYVFTIRHPCSFEKTRLIQTAAENVYPRILGALLDNGADSTDVLRSYRKRTCVKFDRPETLNGSDKRREVMMLLIKHEVKLNPTVQKPGFSTRDIFGCYINDDFEKEMSRYWDNCLEEVERMKEITLFDVFAGRVERKFPIYADILKREVRTVLAK